VPAGPAGGGVQAVTPIAAGPPAAAGAEEQARIAAGSAGAPDFAEPAGPAGAAGANQQARIAAGSAGTTGHYAYAALAAVPAARTEQPAEQPGGPAGAAGPAGGPNTSADSAGPAGPAGAEPQQPAGSAVPAEPAVPGGVECTRAADPAVAPQQPAGPAGPPGTAADPAGTAGTAGAHQPSGPAGTAVEARRARAAGAAVAKQEPAGGAVCPGPRGPVGAVADQRAPGQRQAGRIDRTEQTRLHRLHRISGKRRSIAGLRAGIGPRTRGQRLHKLGMKCRRLSAERLKVLTVARKQRRDRRRHLILGRGQNPRRRGGRGRVSLAKRRAETGQIGGGCPQHLRHRDHERHLRPPDKSRQSSSRRVVTDTPAHASRRPFAMAGRPPLREGFGVGDVAGERPPQPDQPASRSTITDLEFTHKFVAHPRAPALLAAFGLVKQQRHLFIFAARRRQAPPDNETCRDAPKIHRTRLATLTRLRRVAHACSFSLQKAMALAGCASGGRCVAYRHEIGTSSWMCSCPPRVRLAATAASV
jgi:hypothetical protein